MQSHNTQKDNVGLAITLALCAYCLHVAGDTVLKILSEEGAYSAMAFMFIFTSLLCTLGYMGVTRQLHMIRHKPRKHIVRRAVVAAIALCAAMYNLTHMTLGEMYSLGFVVPAVSVALAWVALGEKPKLVTLAALIIGAMGIFSIFQPESLMTVEGAVVATVRVIAAAVCVIMTRSCRHESPFVMSVYSTFLISVVLLPFAWEGLSSVTLKQVFTCVGIGVLSALATQASIRSIQLAPVNVTAPTTYFKFLAGVVVGYLVWGHIPSQSMVVGAGLVIISSVLVVSQTRVEPVMQQAFSVLTALMGIKKLSARPVRR